jgi:hypothetical protein
MLCDEPIFSTEIQSNLLDWITLYETKLHLEQAFETSSHCFSEIGQDIADELALLIAEVQEHMDSIQDNEVPDCSPAGEPM